MWKATLETHKMKFSRHKPTHLKLHVPKLGGCCCRKRRCHTSPCYTAALSRRNHSHGSSSAHVGTKAQVITSGFGWLVERKTKRNNNKKDKRMNRCNLQGKGTKKEKANGTHGNSLPLHNWLL